VQSAYSVYSTSENLAFGGEDVEFAGITNSFGSAISVNGPEQFIIQPGWYSVTYDFAFTNEEEETSQSLRLQLNGTAYGGLMSFGSGEGGPETTLNVTDTQLVDCSTAGLPCTVALQLNSPEIAFMASADITITQLRSENTPP
jgi:hypothetical protein